KAERLKNLMAWKWDAIVDLYEDVLIVIDDEPYGLNAGESEAGNVLKGLDIGVQGLRIGGQRVLIVPPERAYGSMGVQQPLRDLKDSGLTSPLPTVALAVTAFVGVSTTFFSSSSLPPRIDNN
nr:peptidyl-prolyl cis-trans isomerase FKBP16-4, chloroplastic [Tanacetum cinerariifolium]